MTPVRLAVAIADAIPFPTVGPEAADAPAPAAGTAPAGASASPTSPSPAAHEAASRRRGPRRWIAALLRRPAEYARAYLNAGLRHEVGSVAAALHRLEAWTPAVGASLAHANAQADAAAMRLDALETRLRQAEAEQERALSALAEQGRRAASLTSDAVALGRRAADTGDALARRLDGLARTAGVLEGLGPRLDELEIKVRPVMEVDGESVAVRTADGYVMLPRSEPLFVLQVANATSGGLEPGVRRVLRTLLQPGDACADVGANVGLLTVAMAHAVGPAGRVWAFEPEARVRAQLARTLHLNGLAQVRLSDAAAGAEAGRLTFHQSPIIGHSSLYDLPEDEQSGERAVEVEVVTLDAVVPPGTALAAVKIDVEGGELDVLAGMSRVAADSPDLAVVAEFGPSHLTRTGTPPQAWFAAFADLGLQPHLIREPGGETAPTTAADLSGVDSANLVFVRPGGAAEGRLPR